MKEKGGSTTARERAGAGPPDLYYTNTPDDGNDHLS
jgi:hypothetical protein